MTELSISRGGHMSMVHSSYGNIHIDENGYVKSIDYYEEEKAGLDLILQFDLVEYESVYGERDSHYDILDLGYWQYDSTYVEPEEEFRKIIKDNIVLTMTPSSKPLFEGQ